MMVDWNTDANVHADARNEMIRSDCVLIVWIGEYSEHDTLKYCQEPRRV